MAKFSLSNKYSLKVGWDGVVWNFVDRYVLLGAYLSGPVLQIANDINANDKLVLDFYTQFYKHCSVPFLAEVSWGAVSSYNSKQRVLLSDCSLTYTEELYNKCPLSSSDSLLIDTQNHTVDDHVYSLTYLTYVLNKNGELYDAT